MTPLTPAVFHILLALAGGKRHGYAISKEVLRQTDGRMRMGPGTLYGAITRLEQRGFIRPVASDDRRQPYKLTAAGKRFLEEELAGLESLVRTGLRRLKQA